MAHGKPCWFELSTSDLDAAARFYQALFGWQIGSSEMPGMDYRLARSGEDMVAGLMDLSACPDGTPPNWLIYFDGDSADDTARATASAGGRVLREPADVPGVGRFAVLADPQGAVFGVLQPDLSALDPATRARLDAGEEMGAWNQDKAGHGNWIELMSTDPEAGFAFYAGLFGWTAGEAIEMGEAGTYQMFRLNGTDIGGMMGLGDAPMPVWLPYFGVDTPVSAAIDRIRAEGGQVHVGPVEVPGPAWIAVAQDPQGAWFAVVGASA